MECFNRQQEAQTAQKSGKYLKENPRTDFYGFHVSDDDISAITLLECTVNGQSVLIRLENHLRSTSGAKPYDDVWLALCRAVSSLMILVSYGSLVAF